MRSKPAVVSISIKAITFSVVGSDVWCVNNRVGIVCTMMAQVFITMIFELHWVLDQGCSLGVHGPLWSGIHKCKLWQCGGG